MSQNILVPADRSADAGGGPMQARDVQPQASASAPSQEGAANPFSEATVGQTAPRLEELLDTAQQTAHGMIKAEDTPGPLRERFEHTEDQGARGELAAEALDLVEGQLQLTRERRQRLEGIKGTLWARRNRLERFLIHARGRDWWHARRDAARAEAHTFDRT